MKKTLIALTVGSALMAIATTSQAVSLYDYDQPTSAYEDAYVSGKFNMNSGNQGQTSHNADLYGNYGRVFSSPNRDVKVEASGEYHANRGKDKGSETAENYLGNTAVSANNYFQPNSRGAFWYGSGEVGGKKGKDDVTKTDSVKVRNWHAKAGLGVGYGRVVNVTPMARAIRLVEALGQRGLLQGDLSTAQYNQIAHVIAKQDEYRSRYGSVDYNQYWIADIERALSQTGQVRALGAVGVIKANDVLMRETISTRKAGWLVKLGISDLYQDYEYGAVSGNSNQAALDVGAEYHVPVSNRTQFSNITNASFGLKDDGRNARNEMALTYEVSDRVDWENKWAVDYNKVDDKNIKNSNTVNTLSSTYRYYLTNKLAFDTTLSAINDNDKADVDKALNMGVTYRLK